ncbi:Lipoprotein signal peptidase [Hydrogenophaga intermedia]|uniref:Lipoprotein signal peptidase n=2 Tax=Hydrogenophaga intermedia TaxID=65786 RepID=A0A1L1PSB7_HYDIT|nr:Lipoprotein signal peptidase [Hydrogenophaga intermedia]
MKYVPNQARPNHAWLLGLALLLLLDQGTKLAIASWLEVGEVVAVVPGLNLVNIQSSASFFGLVSGKPEWQRWSLGLGGLVAFAAMAFVCLRSIPHRLDLYALTVAASGVLGNTIDRLSRGVIVNYVDLHWGRLHWPAFNLADVFLLGTLLVWWWLPVKESSELPPHLERS